MRIAAQVAWISDADRISFATLDGCRHRLRPQRHGDEVLNVVHHQAVARELGPVRIDVEVVSADDPLGIGARRAGHLPDDGLDLTRKVLQLGQVFAEYLDADRRAYAGRE